MAFFKLEAIDSRGDGVFSLPEYPGYRVVVESPGNYRVFSPNNLVGVGKNWEDVRKMVLLNSRPPLHQNRI